MIKDAESHADDDRKQRELAEARNVAENAAYQAEKQLAELGDQVDEASKTEIEDGDQGRPRLARVRRRRGDQGQDRRPAGGLPQGLRADLRRQAAAQQAANGDGASANGAGDAEDEVVDAEVVDEDRA